MTWLIQLLQQPLLTWMLQLCYHDRLDCVIWSYCCINITLLMSHLLIILVLIIYRSPSWVFILLWIPWILHHVCFPLIFWERITIIPLVAYRKFFRTTRISKISLPFWEWMSSVKMISWLLPVHVKFKGSWVSLSMLQKFSLVPQENMSTWRRASTASRYIWFPFHISLLCNYHIFVYCICFVSYLPFVQLSYFCRLHLLF